MKGFSNSFLLSSLIFHFFGEFLDAAIPLRLMDEAH
jgi:hypothetical protein